VAAGRRLPALRPYRLAPRTRAARGTAGAAVGQRRVPGRLRGRRGAGPHRPRGHGCRDRAPGRVRLRRGDHAGRARQRVRLRRAPARGARQGGDPRTSTRSPTTRSSGTSRCCAARRPARPGAPRHRHPDSRARVDRGVGARAHQPARGTPRRHRARRGRLVHPPPRCRHRRRAGGWRCDRRRTRAACTPAVLVGPEGERRRARKDRRQARPNRDHRPQGTEGRSEGPVGGGAGRAARHDLPARRGRAGACGVAHAGPVPAPQAPGHLRDAGRAVPVPGRRPASDRRGLRRTGPLLRRVVRLRPVGALPARDHHRAQRRAGRHRRLRQVEPGKVALHALAPVRTTRLRPRRPEGRAHRRRRSGRRTGDHPRPRPLQPPQPAR
jgi:hypothetical protein